MKLPSRALSLVLIAVSIPAIAAAQGDDACLQCHAIADLTTIRDGETLSAAIDLTRT